MANDIASLGIEIQTDSVKQATEDLDQLNQAGAATEQAAKQAGSAWSNAASQMSKAGNPAKAATQAFTQGNQAIRDQQKELAALLGKIDPVVAALGRLDDMEQELGKHKNLLGAEDFAVYSQKIESMRNALGGADDQLARTGNTAKQTAQALRLLPAQFTDIAVSLQAGQSPFTVLLQQGGQIKDQFGGIGPAISAVGRYALALVNPFTVAAAAVLSLAVAYKQGSDEQTAFAKSLITTGNAAGTTTGELAGMAKAISATTGTTSQAADALNQFVASGKFAQDQLQSLATAAVAWENATGRAVSDTIAEFAKLADDPVKAAAQLNDEYHFLTAAVYEQITALEKQGNTEEAAALAQKAYADALRDRSTQVIQSLGYIETAWKNIKEGAASAWDAMLGVGREQTPQQRLEELNKPEGFDQKGFLTSGAMFGPLGALYNSYKQFDAATTPEEDRRQEKAFLEQQLATKDAIAKAQGLYAEEQKKGIDAQREVDAIEKQFLTNAEKRNKEIKEYRRQLDDIRKANPNDARLDEDRIAKNIANIEAKYKDPKTPKTKAFRDDAGERMLLQLKQEEASLQTQLLGENKLTDAQKKRAEFEQLIADLKEKKVLTADQKSLLASQDAIKAQLSKNVAVAEEVRLHNESLQMQERVRQLQATIESSQDNRQEQYRRQLEAFGMGKEQLERVRAQASVFREYQRYQAQLDKATPKDLLGSEQYKTAAAEIKSGLNDALAANEDYYDKLDKKRGDWANGAKESFADYLDSAKDVAGQTYDLFSNALKGTEDALVEFVRTGKLSFSDLANSIIEDLVRIQVRKAIAFGVESFQGSSLFSSIFGGAQNVGSAASAAGYSTAGYAGAYGFDGGGYTGDLPRMGGVDGKGGFMAILHPQETVIDHTKPSRTQGGNSTSNVFHINVSGDGSERERKQAGATIGREINRVIQRSARFS